MKVACIYHSIDLDGWMSAAIVKHWFLENYKSKGGQRCRVFNHENNIMHLKSKEGYYELGMLGYNYGQSIPDLSEYDEVIMCDVSFPKEDMKKIASKIVWIDHHKSAIETNKELSDIIGFQCYLDTNFAACELTWNWFFNKHPDKVEEGLPEIVRLLGRYDCMLYKGTEEEQKVLEFQYGARQVITNYEEAYKALISNFQMHETLNLSYLNYNILNNGIAIYQYLCTEAKQVYKNGFEINVAELIDNGDKGFLRTRRFICVNKERFNPINFGIDYHKEGYDGAACFWYLNNEWHFSLYSDNGEVDCSVIAKQYGGGGHKGAAGFRIKDINSIIKQ